MQKSLFENEMLNIVQKPTLHKTDVSRSTFYQGDCLVEMDKIEDKSVDLILCDLPYGTTACAWDIIIPFEPLWKQYKRIIKDKGVIVLFGSEPFSSLLRTSNLSWYKYDWIWEKNNAGNFQLVNYQPLKIHETISVFYNETSDMEFANIMLENMKRLGLKNIDVSILELSRTGGMTGWVTNKLNGSQLPTAEQWAKICNLFEIENEYEDILSKVKRITYNLDLDDTNIICSNKGKTGSLGHLSSESKRDNYTQTKTGYPKSILKYDRETGLHPTQKPVPLMEFLINTYSNKGELVVDNCMGSGTSGVACKKTGRHFIGIEKDEKYFDIAVSRVSAYCG
ncbi:MAG: site-specific DNA-methyltransferase [Flavobacteriales bacterium]|nr:site-specific DNA-methyltransferase [Flavobacteriales bacterium]